MADIKVSDMTALSSVPGDAKIYVVVPGDPTPYYTTKAELLAGISAGFFPDGSSIADWRLSADTGEFWFYRNDGSGDVGKMRIETEGISFFDDAGNFKYWIKKPVSGTSFLVTPATSGDETIATREWTNNQEFEKQSNKGIADGYVPLNSSSLIPSQYLPSFVDDVIEGFKSGSSFYRYPDFTSVISPDTGKIYVDLVFGQKYKQYRWTAGAGYVQISNGFIGSTDDVPEGSNLYYTDARVRALLATSLLNGVMKLFTSTGSATDGAMTQKAVTDALDLKANITLTPKILLNNNPNITTTGTQTVCGTVQIDNLGTAWSIDVNSRMYKSGTTSLANLRVYLNDTANLNGSPTLLGISSIISATNRFQPLDRTFEYSGGVLRGINASNSVSSDEAATSGQTELALTINLNNSTTRFLVFSIERTGTAGDTVECRMNRVIFYPNV